MTSARRTSLSSAQINAAHGWANAVLAARRNGALPNKQFGLFQAVESDTDNPVIEEA